MRSEFLVQTLAKVRFSGDKIAAGFVGGRRCVGDICAMTSNGNPEPSSLMLELRVRWQDHLHVNLLSLAAAKRHLKH